MKFQLHKWYVARGKVFLYMMVFVLMIILAEFIWKQLNG
jgi:hypothetical protein